LYRRTETTDWQRLDTVVGDGSGTLHYEDRTVGPGNRYAYRLGYTEGGRELFSAESWVQVPEAFAFTLEGFRPNPAIGGAIASFTLPSAEPATLELLDLTGRRVVSREVGALGAGRHTLRLDSGSAIPAGVYWIRLRQGSHSRVTRGVVMK